MYQHSLLPYLYARIALSSHHYDRSQAAHNDAPEDGRLRSRGPVHVLPGRGPEADWRHRDP